jgi:protein phosphatase
MKLVMAAATDVGSVRETNEDFFYYSKSSQLVVVCDGMGGHQSGAVASRVVGKTVRDVFFHSDFAEIARLGEDVMDKLPPLALRLVVGARLANHRLRVMAERDAKLRGMGTTLVALAFGENSACAVHIGDSRLLCLRKKSLLQLTEDHSLVNQLLQDRDIRQDEVKHFRKKNVLTRALGTHPAVKVDVQWFAVHTDDIFLLCSDGLHNALENDDIKQLLLRHRSDIQKTADILVQEAKVANGSDNITAAVVSVGEVPSAVNTKDRVQITVPEETARIAVFENKFIQEKYPQAKSGLRLGRIKSKLKLFMLSGVMGTLLIAGLIYGFANRSMFLATREGAENNGALIAFSDMTGSAGLVDQSEQTPPAVKPINGQIVFLHVDDPGRLQTLRNLAGVRILDQLSPEQHRRPLVPGMYSLVIVDSLQRIIYRKDGIRLQTINADKNTALPPSGTATAKKDTTLSLRNPATPPVNNVATRIEKSKEDSLVVQP